MFIIPQILITISDNQLAQPFDGAVASRKKDGTVFEGNFKRGAPHGYFRYYDDYDVDSDDDDDYDDDLRAISIGALHTATSGIEAKHPILLNLPDFCRHINSFGDVEFFGCFVRGVVHGVCWRSLPGGGFLVSPDHKFSGPSVTFLYPDCR